LKALLQGNKKTFIEKINMKKISTLKTAIAVFATFAFLGNASAQITENFDDITLLAGNGWSLQNLSTPVGSTNWFQGTAVSGGGPFDSYNGVANSYIGANYNNTGNTGTISNWLLTPNVTLRNGDVFTFYSRKVSPDSYADRLEVRMSTNGASTNAGTNATTFGDFTTLLMSINPNLVLGVYPVVWTQYTITISGLSAPTSGRLGFRYFVTGAGLSGTNSDYVGIDAFQYTPYVCPGLTISPTSIPNGTAGTAYNQTLSQTGALGSPSYSVTAGALPPGITLSATGTISGTPTATGTFNFTASVSDASGCTGSQAFSITVVCPTGGATLSSFPSLCMNGTPYSLVEGSPAGGTYSGTGVSGGMFNPSAGTQLITYTLIDAYGCTQTTSSNLTVNTPPTVTLSSFSPVCDNGGTVTLTGEFPSGGTFSGTNVSGGMFDPSAGTQNVTYTYTDVNGCSSSASQSFPVNTSPTVTQTSFNPICIDGGMQTLTGGSPAGGVYSGTGVSGGMFDPNSGTQTITYTYSDANSCSNSASQLFTVNALPTVIANSTATSSVCPGTPVTLSGSGATSYSWTGGVTDAVPFNATVTTTYTVTGTDANGCSGTDMTTVTVNPNLVINLGGTITQCGGNVLLDAQNAGATYLWSTTESTQSITVSASGTYFVDVTDGNGCTGSDTAIVTINPIPTVTASATSTNVCLSDPNVALTGSPAGGTWSGAGVTGSSFSPSAAGTGPHFTTYTFTDANGCTGTGVVTISVNACVGFAEQSLENGITIFPNPNNGTFTLDVNTTVNELQIEITDMQGRIVYASSENDVQAGFAKQINIDATASGLYFMRITANGQQKIEKISVQK
jgi:hypothetical protein